MTSFKEPNFSYTEATLRREVYADNSHWELMYKAMLAQLMTYVDAAVARSLAERGIDDSFAERTRAAAQGHSAAARPSPADAHRYEPGMGTGPFDGVVLPPWLQPFTLPEHVRFTRTPDALLRHERPADAEAEGHEEAAEAVPNWKRPVVLPANVRFNRTPDPRPFEAVGGSDETVGAQTFTGEPEGSAVEAVGQGVVIALADLQAERALQAAALSEAETEATASEPALPAWFGVLQGEAHALYPADEQDNAGAAAPPDFDVPQFDAAGPSPSVEDHLAAAWIRVHERSTAPKALRLGVDQSLADVLTAVEAVATDPAASIHPYGDTAVAADEPSTHPFGLARLALAEMLAPPAAALPPAPAALLALPAPDWLILPEAFSPEAAMVEPVMVEAALVQMALVEVAVDGDVGPIAEDLGPYGDPRLWSSDPVDAAATLPDPEEAVGEPDAPEADLGPYGDSSLWLTLIGAEVPAAAEASAPSEPPAVEAPARIETTAPAEARVAAAPVRAGLRRTVGASHGLAPFELTNRVTSDPELYEDPPLDLLMLTPEPTGEVLSSGALEQNARLLEGVLEEFGIRGEIIDVRPGPVVTLYELEPAPGTKSSRVIGLADDIARSMSAVSARVAVVQGRNVIGIELPNQRRETVYLRELIAAEDFAESKHKLAIALGKTIGGESVIVDLARMPHLLVAGTTGSGKSVAINTMILSILYQMRPEQCRLIMIDPKMLELSIYEGIPHLLTPVVTDPKKAVVALKWAVREMEDRYKKMAKVGVRNIDGFNARVVEASEKGEVITRTIQTGFNRETGEPIFETEEMELSPLPYIVVIVDEMADLMMVAGKDIEGAIQRLAQMARAAGIHLIMATQRPSVDVITGTIKANFPTRISFQVTSKIDSRTILGEQGAEQLLGQGDMLHMAGGGRISRVHGPFVSDAEVEKVVAHLKMQGHPAYLDVVVAEEGSDDGKTEPAEDKPVFDKSAMGAAGGDDDSDLYDQAVKVVLRDKKCSTSYIQRRLAVGYNKAASLVEKMEREGIVGQANNAGKREILVYSRDLRYTENRDGEE